MEYTRQVILHNNTAAQVVLPYDPETAQTTSVAAANEPLPYLLMLGVATVALLLILFLLRKRRRRLIFRNR